MASNSLTAAFADRDGIVTKTFFSSTDVKEKTWDSLKLLADADDVTFWTVVANHPRLGAVLTNLITAADVARSSASPAQRKAVRKADEANLCTVIIRLTASTGLCTGEKLVQAADLAHRIEAVLPLSSLLPLAAILFRKSGAAASIVLTSLFLLNPAYLCRLQLHLANWFDQVNRLSTKCQAEMTRGRYQRMSGDVLPLFEQTYRTTKHLWVLVQSAPFVADYVPYSRTLRALRVIVDVISPILQHFLMTCEALNSRRDVLSKANAMIVNTAVNAASVLTLFRTFNRAGGQRSWIVPSVPNRVLESLTAFIAQYVDGTPAILVDALSGSKNLQTLFHQLSPPLEDVEDGQLGKVMLALFEPLTDSKDFTDLLIETRQRFSEVVLLELVQQGVAIDALLSHKFVTAGEAKKLGASEDIIARAMAGLPIEEDTEDQQQQTGSAHPTSTPEPKTATQQECKTDSAAEEIAKDPLVDMVAEVFPQYNRHGIRAALNYYNNDPEQFILDASMENIPPHLLSYLTAKSVAEATAHAEVPAEVAARAAIAEAIEIESGAKSASKATHLNTSDFDDSRQVTDLHLYLGSDLYELITGSDTDDDGDHEDGDEDAYDNGPDLTSYNKTDGADFYGNGGGGGGNGGFGTTMDEDMREKIRMLTEMMYEDELDDGQNDVVHVANAGTDTDEDNEGDAGEYGNPYRSTNSRHVNANRVRGVGGRGQQPSPQGGAGVAMADDDDEPDGEKGDASKTAGGAAGQQRPPPRTDYAHKQFRARVARERAKNIKDKNTERDQAATPAYAKKQKTSKHAKGGGGGKDALTRAFKKGAL